MQRTAVFVVIAAVLLGAAPPATSPEAPAKPGGTAPRDVATYTEFARAIALIEVTEITRRDLRAGDGPLQIVVNFNLLKHIGNAPESVAITLAVGGMRPPNTPPFVPQGPIYPLPFEKGKRYWLVFDGSSNWTKYPQGVIAWWPEENSPAALLEEAMKGDKFLWHALYDLPNKRFYGYKLDPDNGRWTARFWNDDNVIWERTFGGIRLDKLDEWSLYPNSADREQLLTAAWIVVLDKANEFNVPAGIYKMNVQLNAANGKTVKLKITSPSPPHLSMERTLDRESGNSLEDVCEEYLTSGGLAAGADQDAWLRITVTQYKDGKIATKQTFRIGTQRISQGGTQTVRVPVNLP